MSDPQYQNYYVLIFYTPDLVHGIYRKHRFDTRERENDDETMEAFAQACGITKRLDEADINWSPAPCSAHRSGLLCEADTEEKLEVLRKLCTADIKLSSMTGIMASKAKRKQQYLYQREFEEMDGLPAQIANLQARHQVLRDKLVTRLWLRSPKQDTAASKF